MLPVVYLATIIVVVGVVASSSLGLPLRRALIATAIGTLGGALAGAGFGFVLDLTSSGSGNAPTIVGAVSAPIGAFFAALAAIAHNRNHRPSRTRGPLDQHPSPGADEDGAG